VAGLKYATSCEKPLGFFVNISGRYKMNDNQIHRNRPEIGAALKAQGYFDWRVRQRDRIVTIKVTQKDVDRFTSWSNEHGKFNPDFIIHSLIVYSRKNATVHLCIDSPWLEG
jgi:hypothetical protein